MSFKEKMKKIKPCLWELPKEAKTGMRVPTWLFLSERLFKEVEDGAIEQAANVAFMPGIHKHSIALPDMHFGYGFPIGGVAALDFKEGGLSPGGIGFDINCTHPNTKILCKLGFWKKIKDIEQTWQKDNFNLINFKNKKIEDSDLLLFMKRKETKRLFEIKTKSSYIKVTEDHPFFTNKGKLIASQLSINDNIISYPFKGVEYKEPHDEVIIDKKNIEGVLDELKINNNGNARVQIFNFLNMLNILPLNYNSKKLPILLKLMGFILGDGVITFVNKRSGHVNFYGKKEDLEEIKKDLSELGFKTQNIYQRLREHKINTYYGEVKFEYNEQSLSKKSMALAILLVALGMPHGVKTAKKYRVPKWIFKCELWQKRLFLASLFGAEMSKPKTLNKYNFYEPQLNMNKLETLMDNGIDFLNDIRLLLSEFEITSSKPVKVKEYQYLTKFGKTTGLRILIHGNQKNLLNLYEKINFEYNIEKRKEACLAASYIHFKNYVTNRRKVARMLAKRLYEKGKNANEIKQILIEEFISPRFIEHSLWTKFKTVPRIALNFLSFDEFKQTYAIGDDGLVKEEVIEINQIPYEGLVYDVTMNNANHNFIADSFVVSNCGVRLLRTNLNESQIKPKLKDLLESMFINIPSGVGEKGKIKLSFSELDEVLTNGSKWATEKGYGTEKDLEHLEEQGCMKGADASKISPEAKKRGAPQLGTLGAGNHFLEIQKVDKIYIPEIAKAFGIEKEGQVCVLIHTGSRGFGHQVCTDYLRILESKFRDEISKLPDRELVYAPSGTKECENYFSSMVCAANYAWANRSMIMHWIRESFIKTLKMKLEDIGLEVVYDVAHNIGKIEEHEIDGKMVKVYLHRKGATRALPAGSLDIPTDYRNVGQPVLLPGAMATASYVLVGTETAKETFYSTAHGAGRVSSRSKMLRGVRGEDIAKNMLQKGILSKAASWKVMAEEASEAYKDIDEVARVTEEAGISKRIVRLVPLGVIKG